MSHSVDLLKFVFPEANAPNLSILAPSDRVATTFFGRAFPVEARDREDSDAALPPAFAGLPEFIHRELPASTAFQNARTRADLYSAHEALVTCSRKVYRENAEFIQNVVRVNVEGGTLWANDPDKFDAMRLKMEEWSRKLPNFDFQRPPHLGLELHGKPDPVVQATLDGGIRRSLTALVQKFVQSCECLTSLELTGLMEWVHEDAYRVHSFEQLVALPNESKTDTTGTGKTVTVPAGDAKVARHVREVLCAKNYLLHAANMPLPDRVRNLLDGAPAYLKPAMRIVTGTEVRRIVIQPSEEGSDAQDRVSEEFVYRSHSALVIGHFVLTSWNDEIPEPTVIEAKRLPSSFTPMLPAKGTRS